MDLQVKKTPAIKEEDTDFYGRYQGYILANVSEETNEYLLTIHLQSKHPDNPKSLKAFR
jgi:hypothetical protein